jgi:hypothetical protein
MRLCCDVDRVIVLVPASALSRSKLLIDIYSGDPEGCAIVPCDSRTWTAWLADDPARGNELLPELFVAVLRVCPVHTITMRLGGLMLPQSQASRTLEKCLRFYYCAQLRGPRGVSLLAAQEELLEFVPSCRDISIRPTP